MRPISIFLCCVALGATGSWGTVQAADLTLNCKCTESDTTNLRTKKREVKKGGCHRDFYVAIGLKAGRVEFKGTFENPGGRLETYKAKVTGAKVLFRTDGEGEFEAPGQYTIDTARKTFTMVLPPSEMEKATGAPLSATYSGNCTIL